MKQIFQLRETNRTVRNQYKLNLSVPKVNQVSYGEKSLRFYGPKIWNLLPLHVKTSENVKTFKDIIVVHVTEGCVRVELNLFCLKSSSYQSSTQHPLTLYTPHIQF